MTVNTTSALAKKALPRVGFLFVPGAVGIERLLRERVDSFREVEVELGEAALAVRGKNQAHLVVANVDVGMMFLVLGNFRDPIHEIDRFGKVVELERALDMLLLQLPLRDLFQ